MLDVDAFLTAYDPSDLPGASMDPLGFDRGYLYLADKLLPGLTNVASVPRYFSMLCAGTSLSPVEATAPARKQREARRDTAMRLERLWALANYLTVQRNGGSLGGLRGVRYVAAEAQRLEQTGSKEVDPDYKLLSRQAPYGALGIYGAVAEELRLFVDREAMVLSPDAGLALAEAFRDGTKMPASVRRAVLGEGTVTTDTLAKWGESAHLDGPHAPAEAEYLRDAVARDPVRARMCAQLRARPARDGEDELSRLADIAGGLDPSGPDADLRDAIVVILAFEHAYSWALLGFERLLWRCRESSVPLGPAALADDPVLAKVSGALAGAVRELEQAFTRARTGHVGAHPDPLVDVREFLVRAATCAPDVIAVAEELLRRHADVQRGKFDRGRRKLPWIEQTTGGLALTMTRVGGADVELTSTARIRAHAYRLHAADAFIAVGSTP